VKILDFGIAKITDAPSLTGSQQIFGTPGYIAPEYIQSTAIDGRADLYSLGVILYEMVTAALPFDYEYPGDLLVKHVTEPPVRPRIRRPDLLQPIEDFVLRCLEKDPDKRFRDAFHFLDELKITREQIGTDLSWGGMNEGVDLARTNEDLQVARDAPTEPPPPGELPFGAGAASSPAIDVEGLEGLTQRPPPSDLHPEDEDGSTTPRRPLTADYDRRRIPVAPKDELLDLSVEVEGPFDDERPATPLALVAERTSGEHGLAGVKKWRHRFDALREALDEVGEDVAPPAVIAHHMAEAERTLEALEEGVRSAQMHQSAVESLVERGREARASLGGVLDGLAGELSKLRGELQHLVERRADLTERKEAAGQAERRDPRGADRREPTGRVALEGSRGKRGGEADALLWELAAVEEELRVKGEACDEREAKIAELRAQLERENEDVEIELSVQVHLLDGEMTKVIQLAAELRVPLDEVESYVRSSWDESGTTDMRQK
jgi:hypothetical protein